MVAIVPAASTTHAADIEVRPAPGLDAKAMAVARRLDRSDQMPGPVREVRVAGQRRQFQGAGINAAAIAAVETKPAAIARLPIRQRFIEHGVRRRLQA